MDEQIQTLAVKDLIEKFLLSADTKNCLKIDRIAGMNFLEDICFTFWK